MTFGINDIPVAVWVLLGSSLIAGMIVAIWQWQRANIMRSHVAALNRAEHSRDTNSATETVGDDETTLAGEPTTQQVEHEKPGVTVIVDARNELTELRQCLPRILHQDYPTFEVIVVVGAQGEAAGETLSEIRSQFDNLHVTFAPRETRGLSRKKLALMLGIKASEYPIILTTNANCRPSSERWLSLMMSLFEPGVDVVLGYSHYRYSRDRGPGKFYRVFDTVSTGTQWIVSALSGHPYRGTCDNLAYRKQVFFDHSGFAKSMHLQWGDDDVWVSEISTASNTRVQLLPESQLHSHYDNMSHAHTVWKMRRDFTAGLVRRQPRVVQAVMSCLAWCHFLAAIAAIACAPTSAVVIGVAALSLLLAWVVTMIAVRRQCDVLCAPRPLLGVPLFTLLRPIVNIGYRIYERPNQYINYTNHI